MTEESYSFVQLLTIVDGNMHCTAKHTSSRFVDFVVIKFVSHYVLNYDKGDEKGCQSTLLPLPPSHMYNISRVNGGEMGRTPPLPYFSGKFA